MLKKYNKLFYIVISVLFFHHNVYGAEDDRGSPLLDSLGKEPVWTIKLSDEPASSQKQPDPPCWEIKLPGCPLQEPATVLYPLNHAHNLSDNERDTTWNNDLDTFANEIDRTIFSPKSKAVTRLATLAAVAGAMVSSPCCGYVMYNVADFLHIPVSSTLSIGFIIWISSSTAPAFMTIFYEKGEAIASWIFNEPRFTPTRGKLDSRPHVIKKNRCHCISNALVLASASISAAVLTALMHDAEKQYPVFFYITAAPFYLTWLTTYFHETSWSLDRAFQKYVYLSKTTQDKKEILQKSIENFKLAIRNEDILAEDALHYIEEAKKNGFSAADREPFVFSWLFLKATRGHHMNQSPNGLQDSPDFSKLKTFKSKILKSFMEYFFGNSDHSHPPPDDLQDNLGFAELDSAFTELHSTKSRVLNFFMDQDNLRPSWSKGMLEWLNPYFSGLGTAAKFSITQYVLNDALLSIGLENESAYAMSVSMSVFETLFRMLVMTGSQERFLTSVPEVFSVNHINNCQIVRKMAGLFSGINAALFSLPAIVAGLEVYKDLPFISKIACLSPVFLNDFSFYDQLFNKKTNEFITYILGLHKPGRESQAWIDQVCRRAALTRYANKASEFIEEADDETTEELYRLFMERA
jgi:hypothetical protein